MPCILPVSDLRNYNEVLQNVSEESPVLAAEHKLQKSLEEGERSAKESGWLSAADVRAKYEV
ncbi:hypothetical protein SAMN05720764_10314 [Fibrobacter sp. UWH5]|uniref:hypothetical protein n=1 Tax=Fibrobacter sp. UWH5 TaxID=1896211 RepID=UPI00091CB6A0|nr:hypothetical protein [Fibrobacter sp. UWH5]SHK68170.1 hypothetical protein SAMN05720764_10314 [Fibrobacter sp. UWH5]